MIGMSRGDEEIIDDALDMLVWQRKRIEALEGALNQILDHDGKSYRFLHEVRTIARDALKF
jgi:hypothetical protein